MFPRRTTWKSHRERNSTLTPTCRRWAGTPTHIDDESSTDDDMSASDSDEEEDLEELYERATQGEIDLDEMMNPLLAMT